MAPVGGRFDRRDELLETLQQGPQVAWSPGAGSQIVPPSQWRLKHIRQAVPGLADYSLSGLWRLLQRYRLSLRSARVQQYSPDPHYQAKLDYLLRCLADTAQHSTTTVFLFLDEMGYFCWPEAARVWAEVAPIAAPQADRQQAKQQQWRLIGVLNPLTGQVDYRDNYIVGRAKVIEMYQHVVQRYAWAKHIYVAQDNWSIHKHPDVLTALTNLPMIEPVWLPTYAPWLNPIEKLWRWLRQEVLKMHRLASDWLQLRQRVNDFLDQFAHGSTDLLRYVGLSGNGKLASVIRLN